MCESKPERIEKDSRDSLILVLAAAEHRNRQKTPRTAAARARTSARALLSVLPPAEARRRRLTQ